MKKTLRPACRQGYTIIELLVVTGIMVAISGILAGIFYSTLRGVDKTQSSTAITQNGNLALTQMTETIKQARRASSYVDSDGNIVDLDDCTSNPSSQTMTFEMRDGSDVEYSCDFDNGYISSNSASLIDTNTVKLVGDSSTCSFTCVQENAFSVPRVQIQFQLGDVSGQDENTNASFQSQVYIRNY